MLHEQCPRIIYNDRLSSFTELLNKENFVSLHVRNIERLAIEMFRFYNGLSPPLMNNTFKVMAKDPYNLRYFFQIYRPIVKSVYHRTESISYLGPKVWEILPKKLKNIENLAHFQNEIKTWKPDNCPCRLCQFYIKSVGFF